jgi:chromosome segregation ATPase
MQVKVSSSKQGGAGIMNLTGINQSKTTPFHLTSQQKDLLIIHLKGEVYELKQADTDYHTLLLQIQTMEQRIRKVQ